MAVNHSNVDLHFCVQVSGTEAFVCYCFYYVYGKHKKQLKSNLLSKAVFGLYCVLI